MTSDYLKRPIRTEAQAAKDFAEASKVVCLRCGQPMTAGDHWNCRHERSILDEYERGIAGDDDG